jgi:hypothetical protein
MAQIHPALGASARMTWKVVSFPLIARELRLLNDDGCVAAPELPRIWHQAG